MPAQRTEPVREPPAPDGILARVIGNLRMIIGAPDYARYVAHMRAKHANATPLSREEFARERLRARYEGTGSRCC